MGSSRSLLPLTTAMDRLLAQYSVVGNGYRWTQLRTIYCDGQRLLIESIPSLLIQQQIIAATSPSVLSPAISIYRHVPQSTYCGRQ